MKDFLKYTLATIVGLIACVIVISVISIVSVVGIAASAEKTTVVSDSSLFKLELKGSVTERLVENPFASLMSEEQTAMGLEDILTCIQKAAENDYIKGIYLEAGGIMASPASTEEIRNALIRFKETGKFVVAYGGNYSENDYYICSVADKVILNPQGLVDWHGVASQTIYFKDLLAQLGVEMEVFKVGTYKSAVEPYTSMEMSEENREQITAYTSSIWNNMVQGVSKSRGITPEKLNECADRYMAFTSPEETLAAGLVDTLLYMDETKDYLKQLMNADEKERLNVLSLDEVKNIQKNVPLDKSGNIIAMYYAEGQIVDVPSTTNMGTTPEIVGDKVCADLRKIRDDETIKAVVLRVNSPGGSAYASEQIWNEVVKLKEKKPVIVSMGDYAASGGYYISCAADTIIAQPNTLTGSIGIFGMFPNPHKLITEKLKLNVETVKSNKHSDLGSMFRPYTADERAIMQRYINRGYALFTKRCADGRQMSIADIEAVAQGRVWTGEMAKDLGLVDLLGGIELAKEIAAEKAGIESYTLISYPKEENMLTMLLNQTKESYIEARMGKVAGQFKNELNLIYNLEQMNNLQARMPYEIHLIK
ncbi:MAG: signal peptide peptidase SppA [Bacteroidaceae bacterium]|nr:signal peptide peptidase SppA [Bacteroidaceae bacterium]